LRDRLDHPGERWRARLVSHLPNRVSTRPSSGDVTSTWDCLPLVQKNAVWRLLQIDQTRRRVHTEYRRQVVLRIAVTLLSG
jgi:hypothetical protein